MTAKKLNRRKLVIEIWGDDADKVNENYIKIAHSSWLTLHHLVDDSVDGHVRHDGSAATSAELNARWDDHGDLAWG